LVHGEGTSLSRVGPYQFCSNGNPTTLSILLWSYLILSDTQLSLAHVLVVNLRRFHRRLVGRENFGDRFPGRKNTRVPAAGFRGSKLVNFLVDLVDLCLVNKGFGVS